MPARDYGNASILVRNMFFLVCAHERIITKINLYQDALISSYKCIVLHNLSFSSLSIEFCSVLTDVTASA